MVESDPPHNPSLLDQAEAVSREWLSLPGRRERGFSLGQFDKEALKEQIIYALEDRDGKIIAFVNEAKSYRQGEVSADMMRHRVTVPNGSMDYLFAKLLLRLKEKGFKRFNLGLAALSGVGDKPGATLEERACHQIYEHLNRFFSYKGLRKYKEKFDADWEESFLVYEGGPPGLVRTALALARATED